MLAGFILSFYIVCCVAAFGKVYADFLHEYADREHALENLCATLLLSVLGPIILVIIYLDSARGTMKTMWRRPANWDRCQVCSKGTSTVCNICGAHTCKRHLLDNGAWCVDCSPSEEDIDGWKNILEVEFD